MTLKTYILSNLTKVNLSFHEPEIMGSCLGSDNVSQSTHHYVPKEEKKSLLLSCVRGGVLGRGKVDGALPETGADRMPAAGEAEFLPKLLLLVVLKVDMP